MTENSEQEQSAVEEDGGSLGDKPTSDEHESRSDNNGTKSEPKVMKEYSAEAHTYHAFYDEVGTLSHPSQNPLLTSQSSNVPTCEATAHGAATTA